MKSRSRTRRASFQAMAAGTALLQVSAISLVTLGFALSANANERKTTIITFDAPGAGTSAFYGTVPLGINPAGAIEGYFVDAGNTFHGFLRPEGSRCVSVTASNQRWLASRVPPGMAESR